MIYRIFGLKDTFITNYKLNNVPRTGSNFGSSEILHVYKQAGLSGGVGYSASSSIARILTKFDLGSISEMMTNGDMPLSGVFYFLRLASATHDKTLPYSFDLEVQACTQDWDEGRGRDVDFFSDKMTANWDKAKSTTWWSVSGASGSGPIATAHFDTGQEDMLVDVTDIVNAWVSGNTTNNGFLVKMSSTLETNTQDYYVKMFHGRETFFQDRRPYLEARWNDLSTDYRNSFYFDVSGTLNLYNTVRGQFTNISSIGTGSIGVRIADASGTVANLTGSHSGKTGIYSVAFAIASGNFSGSRFNDIWFNPSTPSQWYMTGTFGIGDSFGNQSATPKRYYVAVPALKDSYTTDEKVRLGLFVRPHDYNPARVLTASLDSHGDVMLRGYYQVSNDRTDEVVVPFGTWSLDHTRLSFDQNGNYFNMYMSTLSPGNVYRLKFLFYVDGQRQIVDSDLKFRVI